MKTQSINLAYELEIEQRRYIRKQIKARNIASINKLNDLTESTKKAVTITNEFLKS